MALNAKNSQLVLVAPRALPKSVDAGLAHRDRRKSKEKDKETLADEGLRCARDGDLDRCGFHCTSAGCV